VKEGGGECMCVGRKVGVCVCVCGKEGGSECVCVGKKEGVCVKEGGGECVCGKEEGGTSETLEVGGAN
jgi:hypothetical protein